MSCLIMHLFERLPLRFSRADLEECCKKKAMVILHKCNDQELTVGQK
jgi:hypothetical protein